MRERGQKSCPRLLPLREVLDFCIGIQRERLSQLLRVSFVPGGIERARVANELVDPHPGGKVVLFRQVADARQYGDGIGDWIKAEDAHRPAFGPQQTQNVFDERRLAGSVRADEAINGPARHGQAH